MKKVILLGIIRGYQRFTPAAARLAMSGEHGTSQAAYAAISEGGGIGTFIKFALPLGKIYNYDGPRSW